MRNEGSFIGEAIDFDSFDNSMINIIKATCGAGKTTAALKTIPERLGFSPSNGLFLTPLNSLKEELLYAGRVEEMSLEELRRKREMEKTVINNNNNYDREEINNCLVNEDLEKINETFKIMTYASFGVAIRERLIKYDDFDCIICDEIHSVLRPLGIDRSRFRRLHPDSNDLAIAEMMKISSNMYAAVNAITLAARIADTWIFGLTATPEPLKKITAFEGIMKEVVLVNTIQVYDVARIFGYSSITEIFTKPTPVDRKRLFYFPLVSQEKSAEEALKEMGRKVIALWSLSHKEKMNEEQLETRDYLIKTGFFPDNVQDLIINGSYELGLNITDPAVQEIYVHSGDEIVREQVRGRIRHDVEEFGVYNKKEATAEKREEKKLEEMNSLEKSLYTRYKIIKKYMDINLTKEDKKRLIEELKVDKGWPTVKTALLNLGYAIEDKQIKFNGKNVRVSIISKR